MTDRASAALLAPRRAPCADGGPQAAVQLWQAFCEAVALLPSAQDAPAIWCSPAFADHLGGEGGWSAAQLCRRLDGLAAGFAALGLAPLDGSASLVGASPAVDHWEGAVRLLPEAGARGTPAPAAPWWHATLRGAADGTLALRLQPPSDQDRATRRYLEDRERLLFTSRGVVVGEMATTLAHELNQPLGAVTNVLRGLKTRLAVAMEQPKPGALHALEQGVQLALDQVQYAARIIGRIRDFTQSRQPRRERVELNALMHNSLALLDWDLGRHGVQLSVRLAPDPTGAAVVGDGVMLQQVMVNLLRNAIDAMAETPAGQRRLVITSQVDDAQQIELAIADTGGGISEAGAAQLFTPFYSTKPTGMGIGLNICRSLIELHQGRLWFTPHAERGCTFHVALPLVHDAEAARLPRFLDADTPVP